MNHELGSSNGVTRAHGGKGAFVSKWVINKSDLKVVSGEDLIRNVYDANGNPLSGVSFNRFCSADLANPTAFYDPATGLGTSARIFMSGEEGGSRGWAVAHVVTGSGAGNTHVLGKFQLAGSTGAWENLVANPTTGDKNVVAGTNDGGTNVMQNRVAVYVGTKTNTGSEVDRAGLTNGAMGFINVTGFASEIGNATTRASAIPNGASFTVAATGTAFSRPEDAAWSKDGKTLYFVTTDQLDKTDLTSQTQQGGTRLWAAQFNDDFSGGTIKAVLDSTAIAGGTNYSEPNMFDNISVNADGTLTLLEDVGNVEHNGKVWQFDPVTGKLTMLAKFDPALLGDVVNGTYSAGTHTKDEESSGVIDITALLGRNDGRTYRLLVAQDHASAADLIAKGYMSASANAAEMVEGGQLLLMSAPVPEPESYAMLMAGLGLMGLMARRRIGK